MSSSQGNQSTPMMKAPSRFLETVVALAIKAGDQVLKIYASNFRVGLNPDNIPLTDANVISHHWLTEGLEALGGGFPVLSALSALPSYADRSQWETYWLVDPLDGTDEFIQHRDEFTINIALIHQNKAVLGVIYAPTRQTCYFAAEGCGAFQRIGDGEPTEIQVRMQAPQAIQVVGSRLHAEPGMEVYLNRLGEYQFTPAGSALKFCQVATGEADLYPRIASSFEWNTAAAQCIVEAAGGSVTDLQGKPLLYNAKPSLENPFLLAYGDKTRHWTRLAEGITGSPRSAPPPPTPLLKAVVTLVMEAGNRVLGVYATRFRVGCKANHSPLTAADLVAHHYLTEGLELLQGHFPVLSEESAEVDFAERGAWENYWLVDPLNGTEEFVKRNGEFTINVALIHRNQPVLGVVYAPAMQTCYYSAEGCGVFKAVGLSPPEEIQTLAPSLNDPVVQGLAERTASLDSDHIHLGGKEYPIVNSSVAFSLCKMAEGKVDVLLCQAITYEWDTAAAQFIVEAAGGLMVDGGGEPLRYNAKADMRNPNFWVVGDKVKDWKSSKLTIQPPQSPATT